MVQRGILGAAKGEQWRMYDTIDTIQIAGILFVLMVLAVEIGYRWGHIRRKSADDATKQHIGAVQALLFGLVALILGFTFSLALQRFDSRSEAAVDEANAIGTAYLRALLLPSSVRADVRTALRDYVDLRVEDSARTLVDEAARAAGQADAARAQNRLWAYAEQAAAEDPNPVTTGLFIQALNDLIDAYGKRDAELDRAVPETIVLILLGAFLAATAILGYASGVTGHRASLVAYFLVALIVIIVFIIIDLDRPRRGLIRVSQASLTDLQAAMTADATSDAP
jgi:hypothetical protein